MTSTGFTPDQVRGYPSAGIRRLSALLTIAVQSLRCARRLMFDSFAVHGLSRYVGDMQGKHLFALIAVAGLLPGPALAGPPAKKPICQTVKAPPRETKRVEPCRKAAPIPWVVDPTPMFIVSWPGLGTPSVASQLT